MSLVVKAKVNQRFASALHDFIRFQGISIQEGLRVQAGLMAERLIQFTPPRDEEQGKSAVSRDVRRLFFGLKTVAQETAFRATSKENLIKLFISRAGRVYGTERQLFRPEAGFADMNAHHQQYRTSRGRVTRAGTFAKDVGRWKFVDRMVVRNDALEDYVRTVQGRVGRGKGGWAAASIRFTGGRGVPGFAGKHANMGSVTDGTGNVIEPYIRMTNRSEWTGGPGEEARVVGNAVRTRTRDILKYIAIKQQEALRKAGL